MTDSLLRSGCPKKETLPPDFIVPDAASSLHQASWPAFERRIDLSLAEKLPLNHHEQKFSHASGAPGSAFRYLGLGLIFSANRLDLDG